MFRRLSTVEHVTEQLRGEILGGRFDELGVLPSESEIARMIGVSRRIVREAIRALVAQVLLVVAQGRRTRIRPPDPEATSRSLEVLLRRSDASVSHLIEVRLMLEPQMTALAAGRAATTHIQELQASIGALRIARTFDEVVSADDLFHYHLAEAAGNPVFCSLLKTLFLVLRGARRQDIAQGTVDFALLGHERILDAVRSRDAERAKREMLKHIMGADLPHRDEA